MKGIITNLSSSEIISLTNLERTKFHLSPLQPNEALSKAALLKAEDMFDKDYFAHIDTEGNGSWKLIENEGYVYQFAGENLARNFNSADSLVNAWIKSDSHRNNIISKNYTDIGVAVLEENDQVYIVQILASPLPYNLTNLSDSKANFSFSFPLSGSNKIDPYIKLSIISFSISIFIFLIIYKIFSKFLHRYFKFKVPSIKHWQRK